MATISEKLISGTRGSCKQQQHVQTESNITVTRSKNIPVIKCQTGHYTAWGEIIFTNLRGDRRGQDKHFLYAY